MFSLSYRHFSQKHVQVSSVTASHPSLISTRHAAQPLRSLVQAATSRSRRPSSSLRVSNGHAQLPPHLQVEPAPEPQRSYKSDLVVVLDMDECLLHSQFLSAHQDINDYRQYEAERSSRSLNRRYQNGLSARNGDSRQNGSNGDFDNEDSLPLFDEFELDNHSAVDSFQITLPDGDAVLVNQRPYLNEFLQKLTSTFETHVFTAAMKVYACPVLDVLDPKKEMLSKRFYRESCTVHEELGVYVKDLENVLGDQEPPQRTFNEKRVVLVDNNPLSFLANPSNGILVSNFYDDPHYETLPAVLDLLEELDQLEDVRPRLQEMFGLSDALAQVTSNVSWKIGRRHR